MMRAQKPLPDWQVRRWFNSDRDLELADLQGRVALIHPFQMFCPGCVQHSVPQAERMYRALTGPDFVVVGLHTVFEQHERATDESLATFLREQKISHPIGVGRSEPGQSLPCTLRYWGLSGTPSLLLLDRQGRLRAHRFRTVPDLDLKSMIRALLGAIHPPRLDLRTWSSASYASETTPARSSDYRDRCRRLAGSA